MCKRTSSRVKSNRGSQLVAASKQTELWDFERVREWAGRKGIGWHLVPTGGQHFNRQAKRIIGILKRQIKISLEGKKHTHEETCTFLQETVQILNSRPKQVDNGWRETPLSPGDFLVG